MFFMISIILKKFCFWMQMLRHRNPSSTSYTCQKKEKRF